MKMVRWLAIITTAGLLVACSTSPAGDLPPLGISNGTPLTVSLYVNGVLVAVAPPTGPQPTIDVAALPPLPWTVEARSPSGRVLTSMHIVAGQVWASGNTSQSTAGRVDLSCGRLDIYAGAPPLGPPPFPSSGAPGDCAP
jgi:hypothetical protein